MTRALVNALFIRTTVHEGAHFRARQLGSVSSSSLLSILAELNAWGCVVVTEIIIVS